MRTHPLTEAMRQAMLQAMRRKGITQVDLGRELGLGKAWVSKMLSGDVRTLKVDVMAKIEQVLEITFFGLEVQAGKRSLLAERIAAMVDCNPAFAKIAAALEEILTASNGAFVPRHIETKDMAKTGRAIIAIVDANREKPGKIAHLVLDLLS